MHADHSTRRNIRHTQKQGQDIKSISCSIAMYHRFEKYTNAKECERVDLQCEAQQGHATALCIDGCLRARENDKQKMS